jgi:ketosteroid isomerase-like protein
MKKYFIALCLVSFLIACNNEGEKKEAAKTETPADKTPVELPYKASYSSSWTQDVSDADLKMVMQSYKDWETGNMPGLAAAYADTLEVEMANGEHHRKPSGDIMKIYTAARDSMSSIRIEMGAWNKLHSTDKNSDIIVTWYDEWDTYKTGRVDSASYHDINVVVKGKIVYYATYKRPKK